MKISFISWGHPGYEHRNTLLVQRLGASMHYIYYGQQGKLFHAPVRFFVEGLQTWKILWRENPDIIFVQNPPIFSVLVVYLFGLIKDTHFIIDSHTGAFISWKWRWSLFIHRFLSHKALATIVHNKHQEEIVKHWKCRYFVLGGFGSDYPEGKPYPLTGSFKVAVIGSIVKEECLDSVFTAATRLPEVSFYITGHANRIPHRLLKKKPDNCYLTDFLSDEQYVGLLRGVDAILVQTVRENTLCMGAFEAVALGKPLILSDWALPKEYFSRGSVYISNTEEGVFTGIRQAQRTISQLCQEILILRSELIKEFEEQFEGLWNLIQETDLASNRTYAI